ncbi:hypothetical protein KW791_00540 [Candidatus Parcubacteria bacterium]|nr:hypothetical protein [Candidatus Parcubacteria bacterium]
MPHLDRVIVWNRPDGGVSVTHLHSDDMLPGESEDDFIARFTLKIKSKNPELGKSVELVKQKIDLPDSSKQDEWSVNGDKVEVDPAKTQTKIDKEAEKAAIFQKLGVSKEEFQAVALVKSGG